MASTSEGGAGRYQSPTKLKMEALVKIETGSEFAESSVSLIKQWVSSKLMRRGIKDTA